MMRSKYKNRKVVTAEGVFDSVHEYQRYLELKIMERAGRISDLQRQVKYELLPAIYETYERYSEKTGKRLKNGRKLIEHGVSYVADFVYKDLETGQTVVEDAKGVRTDDYIIKRKMMLRFHGIKIREV